MKKPDNTVKFADRIPNDNVPIPVYETAEEAAVAVQEEASRSNVSPTALMATARNGYGSGDGSTHAAGGITASKRVPTLGIPSGSSEELRSDSRGLSDDDDGEDEDLD